MSTSGESQLQQASFFYDPEFVKAADEPARDAPRLVWMTVSLLRGGEFSRDRYRGLFGLGPRTFDRDVKKLRDLGKQYGFTIKSQPPGRVSLADIEGVKGRIGDDESPRWLGDTLGAVADALGDVIARELAGRVEIAGSSVDRFLRIATPRLIAHTAVADVYATLRQAWVDGARVRFRYPSRDGGRPRERTVEPYQASYVAGRYYLIGFDVRPKTGGWRQFALDRIIGPIARAGTFSRRTVPRPYRGEDAIGLFKTRPPVEVTIGLSPVIAAAVTARKWQLAQRVTPEPGGGATIVFEVYDFAEAVRWALGFGAEALVIAPPEAVELCRSMAARIAAAHAPPEAGISRLA